MTTATTIAELISWEALDSRGRPTVAVRVVLSGGVSANACVPSGASTGSHEALELRDGGGRYGGRGVRTAVNNVRVALADAVVGLDVADRDAVDLALRAADTSPGFAKLGANAILAVSVASARAAAAAAGTSLARHIRGDGPLPIPMPMVNILSGGAHAGGLIDIQDLLVIPTASSSFAEAIEWAAAVREATADLARHCAFREAVLVADEGGLGLALDSNREALELLVDGIVHAGFTPGEDVHIALDVAATEFYRDGAYDLATEGRRLGSAELVDEVRAWCSDFPVVSVEDVVAEDDWDGWIRATEALGASVDLVGDDLFVTDVDRLKRGIETGAANSVLVKVNQNGTLMGAREVLRLAHDNGYRTVVSARSGETEDAWLVDLAVGWGAGQIKVGSTHRSERVAKWNRLLELEATEDTAFAGPWPDGRPTRTVLSRTA
ncbi:phosphopyruvate hydratase [Agromyces ramosus]|uniref:Enolase n=1 Tax=Agromyces ramosus TaxID=33879 RepID=A0ABU0R7D1_9MICO|nr:phosphopyruvate hydratase [Agromyces ramosus]MDQ0893984.1 enolase [Agromyces ramosus]